MRNDRAECKASRRVPGLVFVCCAAVCAALWGCGGPASGSRSADGSGETLYVEGKVSLRGSQPFPLLLLETRDGRFYMIDASPLAEELKRLQDMPVGVTGKVLPEVKMDTPALSVEAYRLLPLGTGEQPIVGVIAEASPDGVGMRAEDGSVWILEGEFETVFWGLEGAKIWIVGDRRISVNTSRGDLRTIHVTEYGIIKEPR